MNESLTAVPNAELQYNILPLFSMPVIISQEEYKFNKKELKFVKSLAKKPNMLNNYSQNTEVLNSPELSQLKDYLQKWVNIYAHNFLKIKNSVTEFYITQSWCNYNIKGEGHHFHNHPNSLISGVFYIQGEYCPIEFKRNEKIFPFDFVYDSFDLYNSASYWVDLEVGKLFLFPSSLVHSVRENMSKKTRISLSFNTFTKGVLGEKEKLTLVHI